MFRQLVSIHTHTQLMLTTKPNIDLLRLVAQHGTDSQLEAFLQLYETPPAKSSTPKPPKDSTSPEQAELPLFQLPSVAELPPLSEADARQFVLVDRSPPALELFADHSQMQKELAIALKTRKVRPSSLLYRYCDLNQWSLNYIYANVLYRLGCARCVSSIPIRETLLTMTIGNRLTEDLVIGNSRSRPAIDVVSGGLYSRSIADFPELDYAYVNDIIEGRAVAQSQEAFNSAAAYLLNALRRASRAPVCTFEVLRNALRAVHPGASNQVRAWMQFLVNAGLATPSQSDNKYSIVLCQNLLFNPDKGLSTILRVLLAHAVFTD